MKTRAAAHRLIPRADREVIGWELAWEDGTRQMYGSEDCARMKAATCEVMPLAMLDWRLTLPVSLYVECPQCGLPFGECGA